MSVPATGALKVKAKSLSRVRLFVTPWTVACEVPPSMEFSRIFLLQGLRYWNQVSSIASRWFYCLSHQGSSPSGAIPSGNLPGAFPSGNSLVRNFQLISFCQGTGRQRQAASPLGRQNVKRFQRSALHFLFLKAEQWYLSSACPLVYPGKIKFVLPEGEPQAWIRYLLGSALGIMIYNLHNKDILPWLEWKPRVSSPTQEGWSGSLACSPWIALA